MIKTFFRNFFITMAILFITAWFFPALDLGYPTGSAFTWGFFISAGIPVLVTSSLFLTFLTMVVRPILRFVGAPINFLTLGLFNVVISGLFFWLADTFVPGFDVYPLTILGTTLSLPVTYIALAIAYGIVEGFLTLMF